MRHAKTITALAVATIASQTQLHAQIRPDGSTHSTASVQQNGRQLVNIASPSSNTGTSLNRWTSFNVNEHGADIDNRSAQARLIVNEVTGAGRTTLEGDITVLGPRANFIIANPAGIWVNGARFNNMGSLALASGKVNSLDYEPSPGLTQRDILIDVIGGQIEIGPKGLAGAFNSLDLLSRTLKIDGSVHNETTQPNSGIRAVIGATRTQIDSSVSPVDDMTAWAYTAPLKDALPSSEKIAVDITSLGSLTAGKISVIVTDAGAGVRSAGGLNSTVGDISISSNGAISHANAQINSAGKTVLYSDEGITLANITVVSKDDVQLLAPTLSIRGATIAAGDETSLADVIIGRPESLGKMNGPVSIGAWIGEDGDVTPTTIRSTGGLAIFAQNQEVTLDAVDIETKGAITITADQVSISGRQNGVEYLGSRLSSEQSLLQIEADGDVSIVGSKLQGAAGVVLSADRLSLASHFNDGAEKPFTKSTIQSNGGAIEVAAKGNVDIEGSDLIAATAILVNTAGNFSTVSNHDDDSESGQNVVAAVNGGVQISAAGDVINIGALIQGNEAYSVALYGVDPVDEQRVTHTSDKALSIAAGGSILNKTVNSDQLGIFFGAAGDVELMANDSIENHTARIISNGSLSIRSLEGDFINHAEKLQGRNGEQRVSSSTQDRWLGLIPRRSSHWSIDYGVLALDGQLAYVVADKNSSVHARDIINRGGNILVNSGSLVIDAQRDVLSEALITGEVNYSQKCFVFCRRNATSSVTLSGGEINASDHLYIRAGQQLSVIGGRVLGIEGVQIKAPSTLAQAIEAYAASTVSHGWANTFGRRWASVAQGDVGGTIVASSGDVEIEGDIRLIGGEIIASGDVRVDGQQITVRPVNSMKLSRGPSGWLWGW